MVLAKIPLGVVLVGVLLAAPIVFFYIIETIILGPKLAGKHLGRFVVCLLVAMIALMALWLLPRSSWTSVVLAFQLLVTGFLWGYILALFKTRAYMGEVLLDVGRSKADVVNIVIIAGLILLLFVFFVLDSLWHGLNLERFALTVVFLSFGALALFAHLDGPKFTVLGILWRGRLIYWQEVVEYQLQQGRRCVLNLRVRKWLPLFNKIHISLPCYYKQSVEKILSEHISWDSQHRAGGSHFSM